MKKILAILGMICLSEWGQAAEPGPAAFPFSQGQWTDLSHAYSFETLYWPTASGFELTVDFKGVTDKGYFCASNQFKTSEHGGTHIDAPIHFARDRITVDRIPIQQLIAPATVIHLADRVKVAPDYQVRPEDLQAWETRHGRIPNGSILLLNTGWHRFWPDAMKYLGTDERGPEAVPKQHFPGLHPDTARWLVDHRSIQAVGIDTASIDFGQSTHFESHRILFERNIPAFENVTQLDNLPATGSLVIALPMKIQGGSGGPLRVVAWTPEQP